jgi:hypothetical protein
LICSVDGFSHADMLTRRAIVHWLADYVLHSQDKMRIDLEVHFERFILYYEFIALDDIDARRGSYHNRCPRRLVVNA